RRPRRRTLALRPSARAATTIVHSRRGGRSPTVQDGQEEARDGRIEPGCTRCRSGAAVERSAGSCSARGPPESRTPMTSTSPPASPSSTSGPQASEQRAVRVLLGGALMTTAALCWWLALPPRGWWVLFPLGVAAFMGALIGHRLRVRLVLGGLHGRAAGGARARIDPVGRGRRRVRRGRPARPGDAPVAADTGGAGAAGGPPAAVPVRGLPAPVLRGHPGRRPSPVGGARGR